MHPSVLPADAQRLRAIAAIRRLLSNETSEGVILQRVCDILAEHHFYPLIGVCAARPDGTVAPIATTDGRWRERFEEQRVRWDRSAQLTGCISRAIRTGEPAMAAIEHQESPWCGIIEEYGATAMAAVPFHLTETVGVFVLYRTDGATFPDDELDSMRGLADDIGRALENTQMRLLLAVERDRARRRESRLQALWTLAVAREFDLDGQAQAIIGEGTRTLGFEWGAIGHADGGTMLLDFVATLDPNVPRWHPLDTTLAAEAIASGRTFAHSDLTKEPRFALAPAVIENKLRAFAATPFNVIGRTYVLSFGSSRALDHAIDAEDLSYLDLLVSFFSRALRQRDDEAKIRYLQNHDALTGLPNRTRFRERLDALVEHSGRTPERFALLTVDLDRFRAVVDRFGVEATDEIIAEIGRRISTLMVDGDQLFRISADAFSIIVPAVQQPEQLDRLARSIVTRIGSPIATGGTEVIVHASVGMALFPDDGTTTHELTTAATTALQRAKRDASEYRFFSPVLDDRLSRRRRLSEDLQGAIDRGELTMRYMPFIELQSQAVLGCEALVRWQHPQLGVIEPLDFIALAEETDLIHAVGAWTIAQAAQQVVVCENAGFPLTIAINLSARQFGDPHLLEHIDSALERNGLQPHRLEFEVTENFAMRDPEGARATLQTMRARGLRIALDDFGTGHSSLAYLKQLPIDILKIDQSFTRGLPASSDAAIARAILALAESIGCEARAEGIETYDQELWLAAAGCRTGQGYWIAKPLPPLELVEWLRYRSATRR